MSKLDNILLQDPAGMLEELRRKNSLVQCLQTPVSMDITANVLLAVGAAPAMVCSVDETPAFLPKADALYVNMGTLNAMRVSEVSVAVAEATRLKKPWVLDPVACGGTPHRTEHCVKVVLLLTLDQPRFCTPLDPSCAFVLVLYLSILNPGVRVVFESECWNAGACGSPDDVQTTKHRELKQAST
jgi:hypothetical protein